VKSGQISGTSLLLISLTVKVLHCQFGAVVCSFDCNYAWHCLSVCFCRWSVTLCNVHTSMKIALRNKLSQKFNYFCVYCKTYFIKLHQFISFFVVSLLCMCYFLLSLLFRIHKMQTELDNDK